MQRSGAAVLATALLLLGAWVAAGADTSSISTLAYTPKARRLFGGLAPLRPATPSWPPREQGYPGRARQPASATLAPSALGSAHLAAAVQHPQHPSDNVLAPWVFSTLGAAATGLMVVRALAEFVVRRLRPRPSAQRELTPAAFFVEPSPSAAATVAAKVHDTPHTAAAPREMRVEVLKPGLVVIRNALSEDEQIALAASAERLGRNGDSGFRTQGGELNAAPGRGRIYDKATRLPASFSHLCRRVAASARASDAAMPTVDPSHVLINYYTTPKGLLWHRDIYANDGDGDHPIVNLSVGASCEFGVEMGLFGEKRTIRLRSGDAVLFGGPCRYVQHAVTCIDLDERPSWMADAYRLSFTFREATSVLGQEEKYRRFDVSEGWFEQTQRAWHPGQPLVCPPG